MGETKVMFVLSLDDAGELLKFLDTVADPWPRILKIRDRLNQDTADAKEFGKYARPAFHPAAFFMNYPAIDVKPDPEPAPVLRMKPGNRVRYRYGPRMTGVIVRAFRGEFGDWVIRWDETGRELPAFEENLEHEQTPEATQPAPDPALPGEP
jgi:hypothetical protein